MANFLRLLLKVIKTVQKHILALFDFVWMAGNCLGKVPDICMHMCLVFEHSEKWVYALDILRHTRRRRKSLCTATVIGASGMCQGCHPPGPNFFIFVQFWDKLTKIIGRCTHLWEFLNLPLIVPHRTSKLASSCVNLIGSSFLFVNLIHNQAENRQIICNSLKYLFNQMNVFNECI